MRSRGGTGVAALALIVFGGAALFAWRSIGGRAVLDPTDGSFTAPTAIATICAGPPLHYADGDLAFDYPCGWKRAHFEVVSSFSSVLVYLSTNTLVDPCTRTANSISCGGAPTRLGDDGVLVTWTHRGWPGWTFDPSKGDLREIGGRAATVEEIHPSEACAGVGGRSEMVVTIDDPMVRWNWDEMDACIASEGSPAARITSQVDAMLDSVEWR